MTHTLIKTTRLDACIGICAPPPSAHRQLCMGVHTTQHTTHHVKDGDGMVRGQIQAAHKQLRSVKLSRPPHFNFVGWVVGLPCLLYLRLGRVSISFLHACFCFLTG